jgi:large subunit ribosomal protein L29
MNMEEVRALEDGDLQLREDKLRKELFDLRCKAATESIENPSEIKKIRRGVAQILTEQRRREMTRNAES